MDKKAILFNGPPGCGKDTAAAITRNYLDGKHHVRSFQAFKSAHHKFATPLKQAAHTLYGLPFSAEYYEKEFGYDWKNKPQVEFFGKTPREIYISLSEDFAKVHGGQTFFGRIAARAISLDKSANVFVFSDSGFAAEAGPVIEKLGAVNVLIVEIERSGTSFVGDSRGYIGDDIRRSYANSDKLKIIRLPNNQDKMLFRTLLNSTLKDWLEVYDE
jgi:DNA polymerase III delta prime subunit